MDSRNEATRSAACICCQGNETVDYLDGLLKCVVCGHVWADTSLTADELGRLYSLSYFKGEEYLDYELEETALRRNFRSRVRELSRRHPQRGSLWEIGCAYGYFLSEAARYFDVAGCDISEDAVRYARNTLGLDASCVDYLDLDSQTTYDVICMWDVIEHLQNPHLYLEKAAAELRPGGTLAFSTGDIGSFLARLQGAKWRQIHPPTHLHYFTEKSAVALLERLGFGNIEVRRPTFWRSADAIAHHMFANPPDKWSTPIYRVLHAARLLNFSIPLNTRDLMTVYATRF